jgi:hypothetical protein
VPPVFRPFFDRTLPVDAFPYVVVTPPYTGFLSRTTEKLLCYCDPWLHVLENTGSAYAATVLNVDAISAVEAGTVLLKSWLTLTGRTADGSAASVTLKFNTVGDYLFAPVVERIRGVSPVPPAELTAERRHFDHLAEDHFKFMNAAKRSLLPGEHVLASVMQPEMRADLVRLFGRTLHRTLAPAHILILTDRELILVAEEEQSYWSREPKYGSIRTTVPLAQIVDAALVNTENGLQLHVHLPGEMAVTSLFDFGRQAALDNLLSALRLASSFRQPSAGAMSVRGTT